MASFTCNLKRLSLAAKIAGDSAANCVHVFFFFFFFFVFFFFFYPMMVGNFTSLFTYDDGSVLRLN